MSTEIDQMLIEEMNSEDHLDDMLFDDTDGEMIDAVINGQDESIFSNKDEYDGEEDD